MTNPLTEQQVQVMKKLATKDFKSISTDLFNLDDWMTLAFLLGEGDYREIHQKPTPMMVARIQVLLTEADIVSDSFFMFLLNRKRSCHTSQSPVQA